MPQSSEGPIVTHRCSRTRYLSLYLYDFWVTFNGAQESCLALCSGIIPSGAQG